MAYYKSVLQINEKIRYIGKLSWIIYLNSIIMLLLGIFLLFVSYIASNRNTDDYGDNMKIIILFIFGFGVIITILSLSSFLRNWIIRVTTEIVITDKRIIHKTGWISRSTEELNITKVESVDVNQSFFGRIIEFGDIFIHGTGAIWEPLRMIDSPIKLRNSIIVG